MKQDKIYFLLTEFANKLGVHNSSVYKWAEGEEFFDIYMVGGQKMVKRADAYKLIKDWQKSCNQAVAAKRIGIRHGTITHYINLGVVETIHMFGQRRILLSSIAEARKYAQGAEQRRHDRAVELGRNGGGHRWNSKEARAAIRLRDLVKKGAEAKILQKSKKSRFVFGRQPASLQAQTKVVAKASSSEASWLKEKPWYKDAYKGIL